MDDATSDLPSSWNADPAGGPTRSRRWVIVVGIVAVALVAVGILTYVRTRGLEPEEKAWPAELDGRPFGLGDGDPTADAAGVTAAPGAYVWKDFEGWHLWVVNGEQVSGLSGTITSDDGWSRATLASPTSGTVTVEGDAVTFQLTGDQAVAGIDIEPAFYAEELELALETEGGPLPSELLILGGESAEAMPAVITKDVVDEG